MARTNYVINDLIAVTDKVDLERVRVPITTSTTTTTETTTSERTLGYTNVKQENEDEVMEENTIKLEPEEIKQENKADS